MTICFVCSEYPPLPHGGIGTVTQLLAHALVGRGHQVRVVGVHGRDVTTPGVTTDEAGVSAWRFTEPPRRRGGWVAGRLALRARLAAWVAAGEVDVIEVPDYQGWAAGWPDWPVPVVARLHGSMTYFAREQGVRPGRLASLLERRSLSRAQAWCSVSKYTATRSTDCFGGLSRPTLVLPNPVECGPDVDDQARDPNMVVFAGTLTPKKGVLALAASWSAVVATRPDAVLHCYGKEGRTLDGQPMQAAMLARMTPAARLRVRFHGQVARDTVRAALGRAAIAVCPSFAEAFAMAPLEAMAAGCATISTTLGSGPEQLQHQRHGVLVDPHDPATIAAAIVGLLQSDDRRRRLGEAGRAWARQQYGVGDLARRNEEWYVACRARQGSRGRPPAPEAAHAGSGPRSA